MSCARVGTPTGGPADSAPPVVRKCEPANRSIMFDSKNFEIYCDEFLQLKNPSTELIVSPPLKEKPEIILKGKSIKVKLLEKLQPNTTYTFNFGDAITDLHEGNPLKNFEYVVSTGTTIDSFTLTGIVTECFTLNIPKECVYILLHENLEDTAFRRSIPNFVGRTDEYGAFAIRNLKKDTFRLYALVDANSNLMFDQPTEKIGFADSILFIDESYYVPPTDTTTKTDSIMADTSAKDNETELIGYGTGNAYPDTAVRQQLQKNSKELILFLQEPKSDQYLKDYTRPEAGRLRVVFNETLADTLSFALLDTIVESKWFVIEPCGTLDTFDLWLLDSFLIKNEKIKMEFLYEKTDSNNYPYIFHDTLAFNYTFPKQQKQKKHKFADTTVIKKPRLVPVTNYPTGADIELSTKFNFITKTPVLNFDSTRFQLFKAEDSIETPVPFVIQRRIIESKDTFADLRRFELHCEWQENTSYKLIVLPHAFTDIYGLTNDTIIYKNKTRKLENYGTLYIDIQNISEPIIVQLLSTGFDVLTERHLISDEEISFEYLKPAEYKLKIIVDSNQNRKWDTGDFDQKRQPEKVIIYSEPIKIRANWDVELTWILR